MQGESESTSDVDPDESPAESGESGAPAASSASPSKPPPESLEQAQAEIARLKEAWLRSAADFDNFRKRARRELEDARRGGREDLLRALLPVFDNLGRAIQSATRSTDLKAMTEGLTMVERQFVDALGREGISRVPTVGHAFDPTVHDAIQQVETDEHPPGTVLAEVQPGYAQGERLMRAAMVVVAKAKVGPAAPDDGPGDTTN
ncbi:MAG: nucleotide exchange factor GrpE [Thermoplasmata archaeon]|nr:nucleotide exchange factor GrpE [Thermoplasmata archaeon]